ncbi:MAG TPA: sulfatase-like hydrolase/transferase [Candidatus Angelobacter sp.]|nr:sulfatase-like hydrolase/transferase [Candidatus Angelobacter sp.]
MTLSRFAFILGRLIVAAFVLVTALYCLLAYVPFTYHQIILGGLLPIVTAFAKYHPYIYWIAFLAAAFTLPGLRGTGLREKRPEVPSVLFLIVYAGAGGWLVFHPLLTHLENSIASLYLCWLALTPLLWMALLDWFAQRGNFVWSQVAGSEPSRLFRAALLAGLYAWIFTSVLALARYALLSSAGFSPAQWIWALALSLLFHLAVFLAIFLAMNLTAAAVNIVLGNQAVQAFLFVLVAAAGFALALKAIVFVPISFTGAPAGWTAVALAFTLLVFVSGTSARLFHLDDGPMHSPLELLFMPVRFLGNTPRVVQIVVLLAGSALGAWLLVVVRTSDWEFLFQKLIVVLLWAALFAYFYVTSLPVRGKTGNTQIVTAGLLLCLLIIVVALQPRWASSTSKLMPDGFAFLDVYGNYDPGFRLTRGALAPPPVAAAADDSLYAFLGENTNIPRSAHTSPVEFSLAENTAASPVSKPNIFMIVVDSLRPDYLGAYNSRISFTPSINAFAGESVVVKNAFTHYTGTGLSEPSIWTGTMLLHKQYVLPFYPMNSLQKLLEAEGYQQIIARDEILQTVLGPSQSVTDMDSEVSTMNLKMCPALSELEDKLGKNPASGRPLFSYIQPQDIHVSVINKEHRSVLGNGSYPSSLDAPYASRVQAMDHCFGDFIQFLKSSGIYDNSIVILTADHGDSLGERGLWGHAYNLVPETARVPIIIHLPASMRSLHMDSDIPTFLTDITPTLYYLLGHKPIAHNPLFGRPLFTVTQDESAPYKRSWYLIASSYAPVYGILSDGGHSLYVVDGVGYKDALYEWSEGSDVSSKTVSDEARSQGRKQIRDSVTEIGRFFNFNSRNANGPETAQK